MTFWERVFLDKTAKANTRGGGRIWCLFGKRRPVWLGRTVQESGVWREGWRGGEELDHTGLWGQEFGKDWTFHVVGGGWRVFSRMSLMCKNGGVQLKLSKTIAMAPNDPHPVVCTPSYRPLQH